VDEGPSKSPFPVCENVCAQSHDEKKNSSGIVQINVWRVHSDVGHLNTCIKMNTDCTCTEPMAIHLSLREDAVWSFSYLFPTFLQEVACKKHRLSFFVDSVPCVTINSMELPCKSL
jgi:hypothetical protein